MAFSFNEVSNYIICNPSAFLNLPDGEWTVTVRIKLPDNAGTALQYIMAQGAFSANPSFNWTIVEASHPTTSFRNKLQFTIGDADVTDVAVSGTQNVGASTDWQLLTLIRSGSTITQYVGTTADGSVTNSSFDAMNSTNSFHLGRNSVGDSDRYFGGLMAELAVWHREISLVELGALDKDLAPSWFPLSLVQYVPMIRDYVNVKSGEGVFNFGTVVADHPAIIYPDPPRLFFFPEPAFNEVDSAEISNESDKAVVTAGADSSEIAHEADHAPAVAAPSDAEVAHEADEVQAITEGDVASAEISWEFVAIKSTIADNFTGEVSNVDLGSHIPDVAGGGYVDIGETATHFMTVNAAEERIKTFGNGIASNWARYRGIDAPASPDYFVKAKCSHTQPDVNGTEVGVMVRAIDSLNSIRATLVGSTTPGARALRLRKLAGGVMTSLGQYLIDWAPDPTTYDIRLECKDLETPSQVELKVYLDGTLRITHVLDDASFYDITGFPGLAGLCGFSASEFFTIDSFEAAEYVEADSVLVTAGVGDAETAWEFDEVESKTAHDSEIGWESDAPAVTAGAHDAEVTWEFDEAVQRTEVQSAEIFLEAGQAHPVVEAGIKIAVDRPQPMAARYSFGVSVREQNIVAGSLGAAEFPDQERLVKTFTANYRWDSRARDFLQKEMKMEANEFGVEETVPMNFVHSHETAARVLDYLRKDEIARAGQLNFSGKKIVKAQKNQRLTVTVPSMGIASDWQVVDYRTLQEAYAFRVKRYLDAKYVFDDPGDLPADESLPELTVFGDTPPFPVANFQIGTYYEIKPDQSVEVYVLATWDPPEENYSETRISVRKTGETEWREVGRGHDSALVSGFVPGTSYDVRAVPYNLAGTTPGIVSVITAVTAGADLANPTTPTGLTGTSKHGRVIFEWNRHTDPMVMGYHVRFWTALSGGSMIVPPGMKFVRQPSDTGAKPHYEFQRQRGDLTTHLSTWCEVRAVKYNGRLSSFTSRSSATTAAVVRLDIPDGEINKNVSGGGAGGVSLGTGMTSIGQASMTFLAGQDVFIHCSFILERTSGSSPPGHNYLFWELLKDGGLWKGVFPLGEIGQNGDTKPVGMSFVDDPGSGNHTYQMRARCTTSPTPNVRALNREILITQKER